MQGIVILLGIIAIGLFGGSKGAGNNGLFSTGAPTPEQKKASIEFQIRDAQVKVDELQKQIKTAEENKNASIYKGDVTLNYGSRSTDPGQEYLTIKVSSGGNKNILVTGWQVKSLASGNSVTIPKGTYLFFTETINSEEDIRLTGGDTLYLVTGSSPNGASFKSNKCSGYLTQFQTFIPYINNICPSPKNENLSSIPRRVINDACFDYIDYFPTCRIQTEPLPQNWSSECYSFIYDKINYPSCVNVHKSDADFYQPEWRVYLKRSERLWKNSKETIVLYDSTGKVVDTIKN
ncbi:MAG: hypothetical protein EXS47_00620 [Candidatus Zambryskibacteria bacterium]|nr:hypothetical protein [Candidatus Zambryskibacteria bacterium]